MSRRHPRRRLRYRIAISFAVGGLVLSTALAVTTYGLIDRYLLRQRERTASLQSYLNARAFRDDDRARCEVAGQPAVCLEHHGANDLAVRKHRDDEIDSRQARDAAGRAAAVLLGEGMLDLGIDVVGDDLVAGLRKERGHRPARVAESDEADGVLWHSETS